MPREAGPGAVRAGRGQLCAHSPTLGPRLEELVQGTETSVWPGLGPAQTSLPPPSADTALAPVPKRPPEKPLELSFKILGSRVCGGTTLVENSSATWLGKRKSGLTSLTPPTPARSHRALLGPRIQGLCAWTQRPNKQNVKGLELLGETGSPGQPWGDQTRGRPDYGQRASELGA